VSVIVYKSSWLSVGPHIWVDGDHLFGRTSLLLRCLSLFSYDVKLHVDRTAQYVYLDRRSFWFFARHRVIPFRHVERIAYGFDSVGTDWAGAGRFWQRTDQLETFSVDLVLKGGETVPLFRFRGEGAVSTGFTGALLGDSLIDVEGTQADASRAFVDLLAKYLGVGLGKPMPQLKDEGGRVWACSSCGRAGPPRKAKCLYCGRELLPGAKDERYR
jgi:hypothetical protein